MSTSLRNSQDFRAKGKYDVTKNGEGEREEEEEGGGEEEIEVRFSNGGKLTNKPREPTIAVFNRCWKRRGKILTAGTRQSRLC